MRAAQLIAFLMPESYSPRSDEFDMRAATVLVRDGEGRVTLQPYSNDMSFTEQAKNTGCFRRGKPIIDPVTREIMGYEMEMIGDSELRSSRARLQFGY